MIRSCRSARMPASSAVETWRTWKRWPCRLARSIPRSVAVTAARWLRMREWSRMVRGPSSAAALACTVDSSSQWAVIGRDVPREDLLQPVLIVDQHVPRARSHEDLDSGGARRLLQLGQVVGRGADVEAVVHHAAALRPGELRGERGDRDRLRDGVGHLQERGHAPGRARPAPRAQVFLVRESGIAEVDLVVDHPGQQVKSRRVHHLVRAAVRGGADRRDPRVVDQYRRARRLSRQDDGRALNQCAARHSSPLHRLR